MAPLVLFPSGIPTSDAAKARMESAAELKQRLLSQPFRNEIYGPGEADSFSVQPSELMENPDELASRWGFRDIDQICNDMAGNVLPYGGFVEGRKDVTMSLKLTWHPGIKGDKESEDARDEVQAIYEAIPERFMVEREMCNSAERGFAGAELAFDMLDAPGAKGIVSIAEMWNRPQSYFAFDTNHNPWFVPHGRADNPRRIDGYKVMFSRQGSRHTSHGSGYAQRCYPTIFLIDKMMKQHLASVERASWMPVVVLHPRTWGPEQRAKEAATLRQQWRNILLVPADVDQVDVKVETGAAYATSNATGTSRMEAINHHITAVAMFVRGSQSTSGSANGSFAKEAVISEDRLWKAPTDAAAREAMWNRGLVEPTMLVNRPTMDRAKWPRCSVESSFGEDMALFIDACERGVKMGMSIAKVTFAERTGIPMAQEGDEILVPAQAPSVAPIMPDGLPADELEDPVTGMIQRLSEPHSIRVELVDGRRALLRPSQPVWIEGEGIMQARALEGGGHRKLISAGTTKFARRAT